VLRKGRPPRCGFEITICDLKARLL
jgi:hypothetical protein